MLVLTPMTLDALLDLWRRYLAGELTLDAAGPAVFELIGTEPVGVSF